MNDPPLPGRTLVVANLIVGDPPRPAAHALEGAALLTHTDANFIHAGSDLRGTRSHTCAIPSKMASSALAMLVQRKPAGSSPA
jgi:hypothetical protein